MINWKSVGFKITKKLVYYALVVVAVVFLWSTASTLFSERDTLQNVAGFVLYAVTIGGVITVGVRELSLLCGNSENKQTNTDNETND
jgi:hypothetical protein